MKICVVGSGYVGLVASACFADLGNSVIGVDIDEKKVKDLNKSIIPIYEPGLSDILKRNLKQGTVKFTTDIKKGVQESDIIFLAVGTPQGDHDYKADLSAVYAVAKSIGQNINGYKVIVDKSTVPVGTADEVTQIIKDNMKEKHTFDVVSNPEFLREGEAIGDFMMPDRIVVGADTEKARKVMEDLYKGIVRVQHPILFTDVKTAELIKYASNAMLATRISFMNELSKLCESTGGDIKMVAKGMGLDSRIGPRFLQAGVGYGGSCFPKDVKALIATLEDNGCSAEILRAVEDVNEQQKRSLLPKVKKMIPDLKGKKIAVWGLAFKPKTDDMREAPSVVVIDQLQKEGAKIHAFDPEAQEVAKKMISDVDFFPNPYDCVKDCDGLVIITEWNIFRDLDKKELKKLLKHPVIIDGRNVYDPWEMKELGFKYLGVGRNGKGL